MVLVRSHLTQTTIGNFSLEGTSELPKSKFTRPVITFSFGSDVLKNQQNLFHGMSSDFNFDLSST
jgi:hypothetical protein